ncbi:MAG: response regulator transcription factor [Acidimicrobiales bacterium]
MRVVVAEDSAVIRAGIVEIVADRGHKVPAAVGDPASLIEAVARHHPDVVLIDVRMPPTYTDEGLRAALTLRQDHPGLPVLVFSQYVETRFLGKLLGERGPRGAAGIGYLLKDRVGNVADFTDALTRVAGGGTALDPEVIAELIGASSRSRALDSLTPREREVLTLMAEGRSNATIATRLTVSERAVEKHISSIFLKFDLPPSNADHRRVLAVLEYLRS